MITVSEIEIVAAIGKSSYLVEKVNEAAPELKKTQVRLWRSVNFDKREVKLTMLIFGVTIIRSIM